MPLSVPVSLHFLRPVMYTEGMRKYQIGLLALFLVASLISCSPGHLGGNEIAFIRNGQLWTIDPSGANGLAIVAENTPIISFAWSPSHQILAYRSLDATFAKTAAAKNLTSNPLTGVYSDLPSTINTISIDGGAAIPIMFSNPDLLYSNLTWNSTGTRIVYRQEARGVTYTPTSALWWVSQNDQPGGIAAKTLPTSSSIPAIAPDGSLVVGNASNGLFSATIAGTNIQYLLPGALPGHPLPAALERVLWQPAQQHPALLYAVNTAPRQSNSFSYPKVSLLLRAASGATTTLVTCTCLQFTWSPDGQRILYSTDTGYTVLDVATQSTYTIPAEVGSVPYWSPNGRFLVLDGLHTLTLINVVNQKVSTLLSDTPTFSTQPGTKGKLFSSVNDRLYPVSNSLWAADSQQFLFLTRNRLYWQGQHLQGGKGLYTVSLGTQGQLQGQPTLVDNGNDTQAGWTYQDANTSFLY